MNPEATVAPAVAPLPTVTPPPVSGLTLPAPAIAPPPPGMQVLMANPNDPAGPSGGGDAGGGGGGGGTGGGSGVEPRPDIGTHTEQVDPKTGRNPWVPIDPGAPVSDTNLRSSVFAPGGDARLAAAQGRTDRLGAEAANETNWNQLNTAATDRYRSIFGTGGVSADRVDPNVKFNAVDQNVKGGPGVAATDAGRYLNEQDAAVAGLGGPSRTDLAKKALADFQTEGEIGLKNRFRNVGRTAAKFGTLGLGDVNAELGSIQGDYERNLLEKQNELARSVSEGDIADRFRRVGAVSGLRGQEADIGSGLRGEMRGERGYGTGLAERNVGRATGERDTTFGAGERNLERAVSERNFQAGLGERNAGRAFERTNAAAGYGGMEATNALADRSTRLAQARSLEDQISGQGESNRYEMRGERGYQQGAAQQSLENRIRERGLQNSEREQRTARAIALMQASGGKMTLDQALAELGG